MNSAGLLIRGSFHKTGTCNDKPSCRVLKKVQKTGGDIMSQHMHCTYNLTVRRVRGTIIEL